MPHFIKDRIQFYICPSCGKKVWVFGVYLIEGKMKAVCDACAKVVVLSKINAKLEVD